MKADYYMGKYLSGNDYKFLTLKLDYSAIHTYDNLEVAVTDIKFFMRSSRKVTFESKSINLSDLEKRLDFKDKISDFNIDELLQLRRDLEMQGVEFKDNLLN
ncbi:hypothetical protein KY334_06040 [Candidatus Woesearchaeota archaeon]|nr:hypothetical protein [Candidatus Woesearchaeota archaeon]